MSREKGIANFSANFEVQKAAPLDARMLVGVKSDLTALSTWIANDGSTYAYQGMVVSVANDPTVANNGVYRLTSLPLSSSSNWELLGTGSAPSSGGITTPSSVMIGNFSSFGDVSGKSLVDSGYSYNSFELSGSTTVLQRKLGIITIGTLSSNADYICDGIADDVQFNAAISGMESGDTLRVLSGTYNISSTIIVNKGIEIIGSDRTLTIINISGDFTGMKLSAPDCFIHFLTIVNDNNTADAGNKTAILQLAEDRQKVEDNSLIWTKFGYTNAILANRRYHKISRNILLAQNCIQLSWTDNTGYVGMPPTAVVIENNEFGRLYDGSYCIVGVYFNNCQGSDFKITDNTFLCFNSLMVSDLCSRMNINGNVISDVNGMYFSGCSSININSNIFNSGYAAANTIEFNNVTLAVVDSNVFAGGAGDNFVKISGASSKISVTSNQGTGTPTGGITETGTSDYTSCAGNTVMGTVTLIGAHSINRDQFYALSGDVSGTVYSVNTSGDLWNSSYSTVLANSANWGSGQPFITSGVWQQTGSLAFSGGFFGINKWQPQDQLHVYGTDTVPDADDVYQNNIIIDGLSGSDKGMIWMDDGKKTFYDQMWRGEQGNFKYLYNFEANRDLEVISKCGRFGLNKQPDIINYHNLFVNPTIGQLNDMDSSGSYSKAYDTQYEVSIYDIITAQTNKMIGVVGSQGWSATNWTLITGNQGFTHISGNNNNLYLQNSALEPGSVVSGTQLRYVFTISNYVTGSVTPFIGAVTDSVISGNGVHFATMTAVGSGNAGFTPTTNFAGTISNISYLKLSNTNDMFRWRKSADYGTTYGSYSTPIEITGGPIVLENGFTANFGNTSGHNGSDVWQKYAYAQLPQGTLTVNPTMFTEVLTTSDYANVSASYTDVTFNLASSLASDVVTPFTTPSGAIYIGFDTQYPTITVSLGTVGSGIVLLTDYWNGSSWTTMTSGSHDYYDGTTNLTVNGLIRWDVNLMTNWVKSYPPNHIEDGYNLYWTRLRTNTTPITNATVSRFDCHGDTRFAVYNSFLDPAPSFKIDNLGNLIMGGKGKTYENNKLHLISTYNVTPESADGNSIVSIDSDLISSRDVVLKHCYTSSTNYPSFLIAKSRGTLASPATIVAGDNIGSYAFKARLGGVWRDLGAYLCKHNAATTERTSKMQILLAREGLNSNNPVPRLEIATDVSGYGTIQLFNDSTANGVAINKFSSDVSLSGNLDTTIPTEHAVKTYVDTSILPLSGVVSGKLDSSIYSSSSGNWQSTYATVSANSANWGPTFNITWSSHGLANTPSAYFLKPVSKVGASYNLATADTAINIETVGVIVNYVDTNNLIIQQTGKLNATAHGYTGPVVFVSPSVSGGLTETTPTVAGQFIKPILKVLDANTVEVLDYPAIQIATNSSYPKSFTNADLVSGILTVTHSLGQQVLHWSLSDNSNKPTTPTDLTFTDANNCSLDLTSYGTITGTWNLLLSRGGFGGSSGGTGEWVKVESYTVTGGAVQTKTFSNLNGNADRRYKIIMRWICGGTTNSLVYARPNNDSATNYNCTWTDTRQGAAVSPNVSTTQPGIFLGYIDTAGSVNMCVSTCIIDAITGAGRTWKNSMSRVSSSAIYMDTYSTGIWFKSLSENITSIVIYCDTAANIGNGSYIELWKSA